jgi:hypothetical protein
MVIGHGRQPEQSAEEGAAGRAPDLEAHRERQQRPQRLRAEHGAQQAHVELVDQGVRLCKASSSLRGGQAVRTLLELGNGCRDAQSSRRVRR